MSFNQTILLGHLGRDPESRYTKAGDLMVDFSMATYERWTDKQGNRQEKTEWHNIVVFKPHSEIAANYLRKGSKVMVIGKLQTREWIHKDGGKRYSTEIVCRDLRLQGKSEGDHSQAQEQAPAQIEAEEYLDDGDIPF